MGIAAIIFVMATAISPAIALVTGLTSVFITPAHTFVAMTTRLLVAMTTRLLTARLLVAMAAGLLLRAIDVVFSAAGVFAIGGSGFLGFRLSVVDVDVGTLSWRIAFGRVRAHEDQGLTRSWTDLCCHH